LASIGGVIGEALLPGVGGMLGNAAGSLLSSVTGDGDYTEMKSEVPIVNNTLMGVQTPDAAQIPLMHRDKGTARIQHREFIRDVPMTSVYSCVSSFIDPTNSAMFPWLSGFADSYQQWKVLGMIFEFKSLSANAVSGTNAGMGSVTLSANYDVYTKAPITKSQANNALFAVSCKPSENEMFPIECDGEVTIAQPLFVTSNFQTTFAGPDQHWYNFGRLDVITQGAAAPYPACGELWVTYDILLIKPQVVTVPKSMMAHWQLACTNNATPLLLLAPETKPVYSTFPANLAFTFTNTTISLNYTHEPGTVFCVEYAFKGGATPNLVGSLLGLSNGLAATNEIAGDTTFLYLPPAATQTQACGVTYFQYDGTGTAAAPPTITFGQPLFPTSAIVGGDCFLYCIGAAGFV
jgi:hypothetical protein